MSLVFIALSILVSSLLINTLFAFRYLWKGKSRRRTFFVNISISIFTLLYLFLFVEIFFYYFVIQTDGIGFTLSGKRWFEKNWKPINSFHYRDIDHPESALKGKKLLFVVGDSFAAGSGIRNYRDRFSNILQRKLQDEWEVINIAMSGWNTSNEYDAIISYPHKPDMIVLLYYINDIEGAAMKNGFPRPGLIAPPSRTAGIFVNRSYFLNYIYWKIYRRDSIEEIGRIYNDYINRCYTDKKIWQFHKKELLAISEFSRKNKAEIVFVVLPDIADVEVSTVYTSKVTDLLAQNGIRFIDMTPKLLGRNPRELSVNKYDSHANETVHREIADVILENISDLIESNH